jgi:hypothetical protein
MKKIVVLAVTFLFFLGLSACNNEKPGLNSGGEESFTTEDVVDVLETAGYELTEHDADAISYFQENTIDDLGVSATVTALYMGYLDGDNWVQVIGFNTSTQASEVASAFENEDDEGQLVYLDGNTVLLTYTQETYDLFE